MRKQTRAITYNTYKSMNKKSCQVQLNVLTTASVYVNLGSIEAPIVKQGQIPGEVFASHDRIEVLCLQIGRQPH